MKLSQSSPYYFLLAFVLIPVLFYSALETLVASLTGKGLPLPLWYFGLTLLFTVLLVAFLLFLSRILYRPKPLSTWGLLSIGAIGLSAKFSAVSVQNFWPSLALFVIPFLLLGLVLRSAASTVSRLTVVSLVSISLLVSSDWLKMLPDINSAQVTALIVLTAVTLALIILTFLLQYTYRFLGRISFRKISIVLLAVAVVTLGAEIAWKQTNEEAHWKHTGFYSGTVNSVKTASSDLPNVILISLDTLNYSILTDPAPSLEHFQDLKDDSLVFNRAFSTTNWTGPSHASLFTGLPPIGHGLVNFTESRIYSPVTSYVQYLRKAGYRTGGFPGASSLHEAYGFGRGFDVYERYNNPVYEEMVPGSVELTAGVLRPTRYTFDFGLYSTKHEEYLRYFNRTINQGLSWVENQPSGDPFFLFLHTFRIHDYKKGYPKGINQLRDNHPELANAVLDDVRTKKRFNRGEFEHYVTKSLSLKDQLLELEKPKLTAAPLPFEPTLPLRETLSSSSLKQTLTTSRKQVTGLKHLYRRGIRETDEQLGNFLDRLKAKNLYDESLIILLSDHGEGFSLQPLLMAHGLSDLPNEIGRAGDKLTQIPLWVKLPNQRHASRSYDELIQINDVFPALFRYLNIRVYSTDSGPPTRNVLVNPGEAKGRDVVSGSIRTSRTQRLRFFFRTRNYKLTALADGTDKVWWRVRSHANETRINPDAVPDSVRKLLEQNLVEQVDRFRKGPDPFRSRLETDKDKLKENLKGLGYL
ncbi:MAG: sulfatase-like hydrolase/transferase [bacterium]